MKNLCALTSLGVVIFAGLLAGCSGSSNAPLGSGTRGEGNIPVGRIKEPRIQRGQLTIKDTSGATVTVESDGDGIFWAPTAQYGAVEYTITPTDVGLAPTRFVALVGVEQDGVFLADPVPTSTSAVVESITIEFPGRPEVRIGEVMPIKVKMRGSQLGSLKPLIWIDGGVGILNPGNQMIATHSGPGAVNALLLGIHTRAEFTVLPR